MRDQSCVVLGFIARRITLVARWLLCPVEEEIDGDDGRDENQPLRLATDRQPSAKDEHADQKAAEKQAYKSHGHVR